MRNRAEILADGLEAVKEETVLTQSDLKLTLLTLEALVDIRDILHDQLIDVGRPVFNVTGKD